MENRKEPGATRFANAVLLALAVWCVMLGIVFQLTKPAGAALKYQIVLAVVIVGALLARRLSASIRERLALMLVSVVVCLVMIEVVLYFRFHDSVPDRNIQVAHRAMLAAEAGTTFDTRNAFEVIQDMRADDVNAFPNVSPYLFLEDDSVNGHSDWSVPFPLSGVSDKTIVFCNEGGSWAVFTSDEHGFNNPTGLYRPDSVDIVLLGDSFAQGACVGEGEDLASQLRSLRESKAILNLGQYGSGPLLELAILHEYVLPLRPRKVLWMYFEHNDLTGQGVLREVESSLLMRYLNDPDFSQHLIEHQLEIDVQLDAYVAQKEQEFVAKTAGSEVPEVTEIAPRTTAVSMLWFEHLRMALSELKDRLSLRGHDWGDRNRTGVTRHEWLRRTLVEAKRQVEGWGGELYFVYVPAWKRYTRFVNQENLYDRALVLRTVDEVGLPVIDLHEVFSAHPDPLSLFPLRIHGHYTPEGYALAARYLDEQLRELEAAP